GDLVAVHRLGGRREHRQQGQCHRARAQLLLELAQLRGTLVLGFTHDVLQLPGHAIHEFCIANVPLVVRTATRPQSGPVPMPDRRMPRLSLPPVLLAAALALSLPSAASDAPAPRTTQEVLEASAPDDWRRPDPASTLYLDLDAGRVVIELAPSFAPAHVENIRTLAREGFWNGTAIYRSHDNFVVQFGDPDADDPQRARSLGSALARLPAEFERDLAGLDFHALPDRDGWAAVAGFVDGFPAAHDGGGKAWMAHCYGALGAGRGMEADSSTGAELYVVIGQSPRQLDRNI